MVSFTENIPLPPLFLDQTFLKITYKKIYVQNE